MNFPNRLRKRLRRFARRLVMSRHSAPMPPVNSPGIFAPDPWLRFGSDDSITLVIDRSEMGQGAIGGLVILAAEELRIPPERICTEFAPAATEYFNPLLGSQLTGGSTSVRGAWEPLRRSAARARRAFEEAAAARWGVPGTECGSENGIVMHRKSGRRARFGELVTEARSRRLPRAPALTAPSDYRWIGRKTAPRALREKLTGRIRYGVDVQLPEMLTAVVARCPVPGGEAQSVDAQAALQVPGVVSVVPIESGIAVLAKGVWAAKEGRKRLNIDWRPGELAGLNSEAVAEAFRSASARAGVRVRREGDPERALEHGRGKELEAIYETPYLAHAPLEPMNCTVRLSDEGCEIWAPTQNQTATVAAVRELTGLPPKKISVHTPFLGGGFGRRSETDFVSEAVEIAMATGQSVHLVWTLDDDFAHDWYRPANLNLIRAIPAPSGEPLVWLQRTVGPEISLEDVKIPYAVPHLQTERTVSEPGLPTGAWRSVGASQNAFAVESFIDELAHAAGADPFPYRRRLLDGSPRHRAVLEKAAEAAGWGGPLPKGHGRGIAVYRSYGSWVAQVAEVSATDGDIRVHRVVCVIDCGTAVDPVGVEAQMEGAVGMGLSAALKERITVSGGRVNETDFRAYPLLRFSEMPEVEVHIIPSTEPPGGVGEPGIPPVAPAVANALFAATGRRVRRLPLLANAFGEDLQ